jgi:hypothetical protein
VIQRCIAHVFYLDCNPEHYGISSRHCTFQQFRPNTSTDDSRGYTDLARDQYLNKSDLADVCTDPTHDKAWARAAMILNAPVLVAFVQSPRKTEVSVLEIAMALILLLTDSAPISNPVPNTESTGVIA